MNCSLRGVNSIVYFGQKSANSFISLEMPVHQIEDCAQRRHWWIPWWSLKFPQCFFWRAFEITILCPKIAKSAWTMYKFPTSIPIHLEGFFKIVFVWPTLSKIFPVGQANWVITMGFALPIFFEALLAVFLSILPCSPLHPPTEHHCLP